MKKYIKWICIALVIVLLVPIPMRLKDGGTVKYQAVLYSVSKVHRLDLDCSGGYQDGWIVELFGIEIVNHAD